MTLNFPVLIINHSKNTSLAGPEPAVPACFLVLLSEFRALGFINHWQFAYP